MKIIRHHVDGMYFGPIGGQREMNQAKRHLKNVNEGIFVVTYFNYSNCYRKENGIIHEMSQNDIDIFNKNKK